MSKWFFFVVISSLACSTSSTMPDPTAAADTYRVTALLNDSTWFGAAYASKSVALTTATTCVANRIDISFVTDLPYSSNAPRQSTTGCLGDCVPTQRLVFYRIPLTVGKHRVAELSACTAPQEAVIYSLLLGGDAVTNTFTSQTNSTGWMQITAYDESQNVIEGNFEVEVADKTTKTTRFKNGQFKALIK